MSSYGRLHKKEQFPQEFIPKNPCRKVEQPIARKPCKKNHSPEEIRKFIQSLSFRDKIDMHGFVVVGLRPGELFALRWKDIEPGQIMIDEAVYRN